MKSSGAALSCTKDIKTKEIACINYSTDNLKVKHRNSLTSSPRRTKLFKFCWWNGGGKIIFRLRSNPELRNFLKNKPDLFVYGESETPSPVGLSVNGYACYLHKSKLNIVGNHRRGLAIFYLNKYKFLLTKVYTSKTFDIVWLRLNIARKHLFFCFFIHPVPTILFP